MSADYLHNAMVYFQRNIDLFEPWKVEALDKEDKDVVHARLSSTENESGAYV